MDLQFDTDDMEAGEPGSENFDPALYFNLKCVEFHKEISSLVNDMEDVGDIQASVSLPSYLASAVMDISSPGTQQACALLLKMLVPMMNT